MAAHSTYFNSLFSSGWKEALSEVVKLDVPYGVLRAILEYMYTGDVADIDSEIAIDLLIASCVYNLERLKKLLEGIVGWNLDLENIYGVTDLAYTYDCKSLLKCCCSFSVTHWRVVTSGPDWRDMRQEVKRKLNDFFNGK